MLEIHRRCTTRPSLAREPAQTNAFKHERDPMIRRSIFTLAVLPLAAGLFAAHAAAQSPLAPPGAPAAGMERASEGKFKDPAEMQAKRQKRLNDLKAKLQLTPAQEPAWAQFTAIAAAPPARQPSERPNFAAMTTPERLAAMDKMRAQRDAQREKREAAVRSFYATLTPAQQKVFDAESARMMAHRHGRRHERHEGRREG
jgi:Spy/CpxP family protein refolding chaperone